MLKEGLSKVFGEKVEDFEFSDKGGLVFKGNMKDYKGKEKKIPKKLLKEMKKKKMDTYLNYANKVPVALVSVDQEGGGLYIDGNENGLQANAIYVSHNPPDSYKILTYPDRMIKTVQNDRSAVLFHELGHLIYRGKTQSNVIDFENMVREVLGMKEKPHDMPHTPATKN